jgi:hypothetical protein
LNFLKKHVCFFSTFRTKIGFKAFLRFFSDTKLLCLGKLGFWIILIFLGSESAIGEIFNNFFLY